MISTLEPESHTTPAHAHAPALTFAKDDAEAQPIDLQPFGLKDDRPPTISLEIDALDFYYGEKKALSNISLKIRERQVTAFIGPSGCGKSTLLRCFNRMNDLILGTRVGAGSIKYRGTDIYEKTVDVIELRKQIGMVFQKSNPFPQTIFDNVAYGLRIQGIRNKSLIEDRVEKSLRSSALWDEVKDRLHSNAYSLSGDQQQRMCIARACAVEPQVILMDEPCSALDPIATLKVEELIHQLREEYTIIVVTHNMEQASRVSDRTAFFYVGELIEEDATMNIFSNPKVPRTEAYISGRFS